MTMFTFWCSQFQHIVQRRWLELSKALLPVRFSNKFHQSKSNYGAESFGQKGNEQTIANYVRNQGREAEYQQLHREQLVLFDTP